MKRVFSIFLSMMLLVSGCLFSAQAAETDTHRVTKVWYSADFNNESTGDAVIRNDEGYVGTEYVDDGLGGKALHIKSRVANYDGLRIDVSDMLGATDIQNSSEGYSAGFRIKAEMGKQFWLRVEMYGLTDANGGKIGNGYLGNVESYTLVTDEWQTVSIDSLYFVKEYSENDWANSAVSGNIGFVTKPYIEGKEPYQIYEGTTEAFYIDDINVSAPTDVTENTVRAEGIWYDADFNDGSTGDAVIRNDEGYVGTEYVDDGLGGKALHIKSRAANYDGLRIDVSDMLSATDIQNSSEGYSAGFRIKAEMGKQFWLRVEMYGLTDANVGKIGNGYLGSVESYTLVTDEWTTVSLGSRYFVKEYSEKDWANSAVSGNIGIVTKPYIEGKEPYQIYEGTTEAFYIDDIKVSAPCDFPQIVVEFINAVNYLPEASDVKLSDKKLIEDAVSVYADLGVYAGAVLKTVNAAKLRLDAVIKAYDQLEEEGGDEPAPPVGNKFTETFESYPIGKFGDSESNLIENDPANSRENGGKYLHVASRPTADEASFYWHNVNNCTSVQGDGKYSLTFWAKSSANNTQISFVKDALGKETYLTPVTVTPEWKQYTVRCDISEEELNATVNLRFITFYSGDTNGEPLYFDDISFIKSEQGGETDEPDDDPDKLNYTMSDKSNLIAPYGDFESYKTGDKIWGQDNSILKLSADSSVAHSGNNSLLVTGRKTKYDTAVLNVTDILKAKGSGKYYLSFYAKTKSGTTGICPTLRCYYGSRENYKDYYLPGHYLVTADTSWKQLGVEPNQTGYYFSQDDKTTGSFIEVNTSGLSSAEIIFYGNLEEEDGFADYYLDDIKFWKYYDGQAGNKPIEKPSVRIEPKYKYNNKLNLLDPYGNFENVASGSILWNGTVMEDASAAHGGTKYLKISGRDPKKTPFDFCVYVTDIINANGAGKYYYSCWLKTAEKGKETTLQPYLYFHETGTIYEMPPIHVTDKWQQFGVSYGDIENYINNAGGGLPLTSGVAEFRFYNSKNEEEFPAYLVDDMAFWRYTDEQLKYPNNSALPGTGDTAPIVPISVVFCLAVLSSACIVLKLRRKV